MTETEVMRSLAVAHGIPVCNQTDCPNVGTHIAAWVTGDLVCCGEHAGAFKALGKIMGVHNVTVRLNPDHKARPPVKSKRFAAIARGLQGDP